MLTLTKPSSPLIEVQRQTHRMLGVCTAAFTVLATPLCSCSGLWNTAVAPGLVGLLCYCITTIGPHSTLYRGNTQGPNIQQLRISPRDVHWYARKKYEVDRYIHSPLYKSSVPILALKCKAVTDRNTLALQQPYTLQTKKKKKEMLLRSTYVLPQDFAEEIT